MPQKQWPGLRRVSGKQILADFVDFVHSSAQETVMREYNLVCLASWPWHRNNQNSQTQTKVRHKCCIYLHSTPVRSNLI